MVTCGLLKSNFSDMERIHVQVYIAVVLILSFLIAALVFNVVPNESDFYYQGDYVTHLFHKPGCLYYGCKSCTVIFREREDAIKAGYLPCKICNP